jgi:hypothetical protein
MVPFCILLSTAQDTNRIRSSELLKEIHHSYNTLNLDHFLRLIDTVVMNSDRILPQCSIVLYIQRSVSLLKFHCSFSYSALEFTSAIERIRTHTNPVAACDPWTEPHVTGTCKLDGTVRIEMLKRQVSNKVAGPEVSVAAWKNRNKRERRENSGSSSVTCWTGNCRQHPSKYQLYWSDKKIDLFTDTYLFCWMR